jgi:hypothetical protein
MSFRWLGWCSNVEINNIKYEAECRSVVITNVFWIYEHPNSTISVSISSSDSDFSRFSQSILRHIRKILWHRPGFPPFTFLILSSCHFSFDNILLATNTTSLNARTDKIKLNCSVQKFCHAVNIKVSLTPLALLRMFTLRFSVWHCLWTPATYTYNNARKNMYKLNCYVTFGQLCTLWVRSL